MGNNVIDNNKNTSMITLYPSPASADITIDFTTKFTGKIEVFDAMGQKLIVKNITNSESVNIDVSALSSGMYFVKTIDAKGQVVYKTGRFVKE